jgi:RNA polymerase sigma-70 factor, ECF subfamily
MADMADNILNIDSLIDQARNDNRVLGELLEQFRPYLLLLAQSQIGVKLAVRCDPSDVVQQTFVEASRSFSTFRGSTEPEFSAWINRIHSHNLAEVVRKHVLTEKQSLQKERRLESANGTTTLTWFEPAANQSTPSQHLIKGEKAVRLSRLLQSLPDMQRDAVRLRYLQGWPVEKIAKELDRSLDATAGLIKRGLKALRGRMSEESWVQ